ncbi:MAG TPA: GtrA family protein [Paracoccaceae bacterium]|jgi:putative flippase GtrA|nr:GtrA family protein [Paracoccaceae bacterium]
MSGGRLAALYAAFGAVATVANLGAQALVHAALPPQAEAIGPGYWLALAFGTGVGLVVKYLLDKRWIFLDASTGLAAHGRRFSLYTVMGLFTTAIFWGTQTVFFLLTDSRAMLYLGGALGLAVGYVVKYHLDRRFVFTPGEARA